MKKTTKPHKNEEPQKFGYDVSLIQHNEHSEHAAEEYGSWSSSNTWSIERIVKKVTEYPDVASIHDLAAGSNALVVWVQWGSGDSFGHSSGAHAEAIGIFKDLDSAVSLQSQIRNWSGVKDQSRAYSFKTPDGQVFESGWAPWAGYFETLEGVNINPVVVY